MSRIKNFALPAILAVLVAGFGGLAKEFLTPAEIEKIGDAQEIDRRVKIYMEAAALRLKVAQDRLNGKESEPGDPMEFFSVEDMLEGYYRILRSVMFNLDDAAQKPTTDPGKFSKALKALKDGTEKDARELEILRRMAEDRKLESVWNQVGKAAEITAGAHNGAEMGLSRESKDKERPKRK